MKPNNQTKTVMQAASTVSAEPAITPSGAGTVTSSHASKK